MGLLPESGRSPGGRNGNPLKYSCLGNPMDRGAWWAPWGHKKSDTAEQLSEHIRMHYQSNFHIVLSLSTYLSVFAVIYTFHNGEGNGNPLQYSCLENPMDGGAWWAAVHGVPNSRTRLSDFTFTFHFPALEKEMATHSSVLAWRILGTEEPGGLPSMGSHRVGHD